MYHQDNENAKRPWIGKMREWDLVREAGFCTAIVIVVAIVLAVLFSSPSGKGVSLQSWAKANPSDFLNTAATELNGSSETATYGPPYQANQNGSLQGFGFFSPQKWAGVTHPINAPTDLVVNPLQSWAVLDPELASALETWHQASAQQQQNWANNYQGALGATNAVVNITLAGTTGVPAGNYGPVPVMLNSLLKMAASGALDSQMLNSQGFFSLNYTKSLMFLEDGQYLTTLGQNAHLGGGEWGMMNESGCWPGQFWLSLYTLFYQIPPWSTSSSGDLMVAVTVVPFFVLLLLVPWIPGLRSLPRVLKLYRFVWKDYYRKRRR